MYKRGLRWVWFGLVCTRQGRQEGDKQRAGEEGGTGGRRWEEEGDKTERGTQEGARKKNKARGQGGKGQEASGVKKGKSIWLYNEDGGASHFFWCFCVFVPCADVSSPPCHHHLHLLLYILLCCAAAQSDICAQGGRKRRAVVSASLFATVDVVAEGWGWGVQR